MEGHSGSLGLNLSDIGGGGVVEEKVAEEREEGARMSMKIE